MPAPIDYFYSTRSIYAYFGAQRIIALARRAGRPLNHKPIDLSRVIPASGSLPFAQRSQRHLEHFFGREIALWSEYLDIPALVDPVHHYGDRALPSGFVIAARQQGADVDALRWLFGKHQARVAGQFAGDPVSATRNPFRRRLNAGPLSVL